MPSPPTPKPDPTPAPESDGPELPGVQVAPGVRLPASALKFTFSRSSGPGGQNVNKLATKATLRVAMDDLRGVLSDWAMQRLITLAGRRATQAGDLILHDESSRWQRANREACMQRLRALLIQAMHRPRKRLRTKPTAGSKQRRIDQKKRRATIKRLRNRPRNDT